MIIVGAGLSGLIAAHAFPQAQIVEAAEGAAQMHKAVLRFRSEAVAHVTRIPFRPVTVRKGIWMDGHQAPNIQLANLYSRKVIEGLAERSIWNLEPATRYIAPEDFYQQLVAATNGRVTWGHQFDFHENREQVISTVPLSAIYGLVAEGLPDIEFTRAAIDVKRYRIDKSDTYQTVYFPDPEHKLYRATITGDLLTCELISGEGPDGWLDEVLSAFGLDHDLLTKIDSTTQKFGKIKDINKPLRRAVLRRLTEKFNIYSLGRFATWRNILLDDVVKDIDVIKRLMSADGYGRIIAAS